MILAGFVIAVGAVVDDAIIDIENIVRRLRQHRREGSAQSTARIILDASLEVRGADRLRDADRRRGARAGVLPRGLTGAFFRPLALSYALAVLVSMVVALTVTPALEPASCCAVRRSNGASRRWRRWLQARLQRAPTRASLDGRGRRTPRSPPCACSGGRRAPLLGQSLLPDSRSATSSMHWVTSPARRCPRDADHHRSEQGAPAIPGVRNFGAHIGQAFLGRRAVGVDFGENWISVDPEADYDETLAADPGGRRRATRACAATSRRT